MIENGRSCCCPDIADVAGVYTHDAGQLAGQFEKKLTLVDDGTFEYIAHFDAGIMTSSGTWKLIPQGAKCFVQLVSNPEPVNPLINVHFDRTLMHVDGSCLTTESIGAAAISFCNTTSAFPTNA